MSVKRPVSRFHQGLRVLNRAQLHLRNRGGEVVYNVNSIDDVVIGPLAEDRLFQQLISAIHNDWMKALGITTSTTSKSEAA